MRIEYDTIRDHRVDYHVFDDPKKGVTLYLGQSDQPATVVHYLPTREVARRVADVILAAQDSNIKTDALRQYEMIQATIDGNGQIEEDDEDGAILVYTNLREEGDKDGWPERLVPLEEEETEWSNGA